MNNTGLVVLGGVAALAYFTRASWLPQVETEFPQLETLFGGGTTAAGQSAAPPAGAPPATSGATGNFPAAPVTTTANTPIGPNTPGATPLGTQGCFQYSSSTTGATIINCPPGVNPPKAAAPPVSCASGFTLDAAGVCTRYPDAVLLAQLNTIPWTGLSDIPAEQIQRIDPQILAMYSTISGVGGGTALAYLLGLGAAAPDGTMMNGSDGNTYKSLGGSFYRQGTATQTTTVRNGLPRRVLGAVSDLAAALPISNATLIMASADPKIAELVGRDPRAMLTANQWNGYYTQASGVVQGIPLYPADDPAALMSAEQYQARRKAAGLATVTNLGIIRNARRGAFPLGGLGVINQWVPPGNRTIYHVPGRGAVPAGKGGTVPPPRPNLRGLGAVVSAARMGLIQDGGGNHRWARSPFPRPAWWRQAE